MTQIVGLTACEPLGRSSTEPLLPSDSVVLTTCAPPVNVQPVPSNPPGDWPGTSMYSLLSPSATNGCDSRGLVHQDVSTELSGLVAARAGVTARPAITALRASGLKRNFFFIRTHLPWCALVAELSRLARDL